MPKRYRSKASRVSRKRRRVAPLFRAPARRRLRGYVPRGGTRIHSFTRTQQIPGIYYQGTVANLVGRRLLIAPAVSGYNFKLAIAAQDITNWSEFQALFDQYKITYIRYKIDFVHNGSPFVAAGTTSAFGNLLPEIMWAPDTDNHAIGTFPNVSEYDSVRRVAFGDKGRRSVSIGYKPICFNAVQDSAGSSSMVSVRAPWLQTSNASFFHYGVSGTLFNYDGDTDAQFIVSAKVWFKCRLSH